jgi:hypothetical protein
LVVRTRARQLAQADARAGGDFTKALPRRMAEIAAELKALQRRKEALGTPSPVPPPLEDFLDEMASLRDL